VDAWQMDLVNGVLLKILTQNFVSEFALKLVVAFLSPCHAFQRSTPPTSSSLTA